MSHIPLTADLTPVVESLLWISILAAGLIVYFLLMFLLLENLPLKLVCVLVICGDCYSKFCASQIINYLPYARKEEDSKAKVVYDRMTLQESLTGLVCGLLPIVVFLPIVFWPVMCI